MHLSSTRNGRSCSTTPIAICNEALWWKTTPSENCRNRSSVRYLTCLLSIAIHRRSLSLLIDFCYTWIPSLAHVHPKSILLDLAKHCFSIIWRSSKKKNFPKIWRLWLKNCARHAHFNFELLKGVAVSFFKLYPSNFSHACIFYRQTNDVFTAKLYL